MLPSMHAQMQQAPTRSVPMSRVQHEEDSSSSSSVCSTSSSFELALHLNNIGVSHLEQKFYNGAEMYFFQAREITKKSAEQLTRAAFESNKGNEKVSANQEGQNKKLKRDSTIADHTTQEGIDVFQSAWTNEYSVLRSINDITPSVRDGICAGETKPPKKGSTSSTSATEAAKAHNRSEYDEGMHCLREGMALSESDFAHHKELACHKTGTGFASTQCLHHALLLLTITYNLGQVHHAQGNCDEALQHFQSSQEQLDYYNKQIALLSNTKDLKRNATKVFNTTLTGGSKEGVNKTNTIVACDEENAMEVTPSGEEVKPSKSINRRPMQFRILRSIGYVHFEKAQFLEAMVSFNEALEVARREGYDDDFDIAATLNCVGVIHFYMPKPHQASQSMQFYKAALDMLIELPAAPINPTIQGAVATTLNNIGRVHYMNGDFKKAMQVYTEALSIRRSVLGEKSLDVAATVYNQGQTFHQLGELDMALTLYHEFLQIATACYGPKHKDIAVMYRCIAQIYHEKSDYQMAAKYYVEALTLTKSLFGPLHPEVGTTLNKIGNLYYEQDDLDNAMTAYQEGLSVERQVLEETHPNISVTLSNIGQIYKHRRDYQNAVFYYKEALRIQRLRSENQQGSNGTKTMHPNVAITISSIAMIYYQTEQFDKALDLYQEALFLRREAYGDEHLDVSATLNSIGMVLFKKGRCDMAMDAFQRAYQIRQKILGKKHKDVAIILHNIATISLQRGDNEMALEYYKRTLEIERAALGQNHLDVSVTLHHVGHLYEAKGDIATALKHFHDALSIETKQLGHNSKVVAKTYNSLANLYLQTGGVEGHVRKAMECFTTSLRIFRALRLGDEHLVIAGLNLYTLRLVHPDAAPSA